MKYAYFVSLSTVTYIKDFSLWSSKAFNEMEHVRVVLKQEKL